MRDSDVHDKPGKQKIAQNNSCFMAFFFNLFIERKILSWPLQ